MQRDGLLPGILGHARQRRVARHARVGDERHRRHFVGELAGERADDVPAHAVADEVVLGDPLHAVDGGRQVGLQGGGSIYEPEVYDHYINSAFAPDGARKPAYFQRLERVLGVPPGRDMHRKPRARRLAAAGT